MTKLQKLDDWRENRNQVFTFSVHIKKLTNTSLLIAWIFPPYGEIPLRKGKYPVLRTNAKPRQLIKHAEISYFIVWLVLCKFSCGTYRNCVNWCTSKLRQSKYSKSLSRVSLIPFVWNLGVVPQKFIYVSKITGHHFSGWV